MNSFQNPKEDANIDQKAFLFFKIFKEKICTQKWLNQKSELLQFYIAFTN